MFKRSIAVLCLGLWPLSAAADDTVTEFSLPNGLDVVVIEDARAPVVVHMLFQ